MSPAGASEELPDLEFRPAHYNDFPNPLSAVLSGVHGSLRRDMIQDVLGSEGTTGDRLRAMLGDLHPSFMEPKAHPGFVDWMTRLDARWIGGENLPPDEPGEVEIARITLDTSLREVTAIRATWDPDRAVYVYRIVDDHSDRRYTPVPATSDEPLSLRELLRLLDLSTIDDSDATLFEEVVSQWEIGYRRGGGPEGPARRVMVTSELYPELERAVRLRWERWLAEREEQEELD